MLIWPSFPLVCGWAGAQEPFPRGADGQVYFCPRVDLLPAQEGGPQEVEVDGEHLEEVWERADWQGWVHDVSVVDRGAGGVEPAEDLDFEWAAVADEGWLYVAWRVTDDVLNNVEETQCNVWKDDSIEIYVDALDDGPDCTAGNAHCYGVDDAQFTVGAENLRNVDPEDPDSLIVGGLAGGGTCDFAGPHPELVRGVVLEVFNDDDEYAGWQGEIAIALDTVGNLDDGTPEWLIEPEHCSFIGWNLHAQDDDNSGDRDHKLIWSQREAVESSWRNPGAFGKMVFVDLSRPVPVFEDPGRPEKCAAVVDPPDGFVRGDSNSSGSIDLTDGIVTLNFLFVGGSVPACLDAADTDDNGAVVISDAVITFSYLFQGGPAPRDPAPSGSSYPPGDCGPDPTDDDPLDCVDLAGTCG